MDSIKIKIHLKYFLELLFAMTLFSACQQEYIKISEPDKKITINPSDTITDLIRRVTLKDGSFDNIIDRCSAISIKFPYAIEIDDQLVQINSQDDFDTVLLDYSLIHNDFELLFPVTILYSDYTESTLLNEDELKALQVQYNTNLNDADIECLDFVYPIDLCIFNTVFQNANCLSVNNDFELYSQFSNLNDLVVELEYPIQVKTSDNFLISIHDNIELEDQISSYINSCDENDEVEFKEEIDSTDSIDEEISDTLLLAAGEWKITSFTGETEDTLLISPYRIKFNLDFTIDAANGTETIVGNWELRILDGRKMLVIAFDIEDSPLDWLNEEWEILELNAETMELQTDSDTEGIISLTMSKTDG